MLWFIIGHIFTILVSLTRVSRLSDNDKDLEIIILRHQLDVMVRKQNKPIRPNRAEKATLTLLTDQLRKKTNRSIRQLGDIIRIVKPETVVRWHRGLVRRKWTQHQKNKGGRPQINGATIPNSTTRAIIDWQSRAPCGPGRYHQRLLSCTRQNGRLLDLI